MLTHTYKGKNLIGNENLLKGEKFGMLTVVEFDRYIEDKTNMMYLCKCECGQYKVMKKTTLFFQNVYNVNCGCVKKKAVKKREQTDRTTKEHFKKKVIPFIFLEEKIADASIKKIIEVKEINYAQAKKLYWEWRKDYRKGIERHIT